MYPPPSPLTLSNLCLLTDHLLSFTLQGKSNDIKVLLHIPNQLATTGDPDLATVQQRADEVENCWTELTIRVETRVKTSTTLIKFEKLAKQVRLMGKIL